MERIGVLDEIALNCGVAQYLNDLCALLGEDQINLNLLGKMRGIAEHRASTAYRTRCAFRNTASQLSSFLTINTDNLEAVSQGGANMNLFFQAIFFDVVFKFNNNLVSAGDLPLPFPSTLMLVYKNPCCVYQIPRVRYVLVGVTNIPVLNLTPRRHDLPVDAKTFLFSWRAASLFVRFIGSLCGVNLQHQYSHPIGVQCPLIVSDIK